MTPEARGPELARYEASPSELRALARVRMVSALVAFGGAVAMLLGELPVPVFLLALLGLVLSLAWLGQARRASRAARSAHRDALTVHARGLWLEEAARNVWCSWDDVTEIEVDEERLDVLVRLRAGPPLRIEPRYPGVEIHELVRTLNDARHRAEHP
ncbi:MAG: hypothetical protein ABW252_08655 [Polyangiales bacterium]